MSLSERIDVLIQERHNLHVYVRELLSDVVKYTIEEVSRDLHVNAKGLADKYLAKIVDRYLERETMKEVRSASLCKGKTKENKPCPFKALGNGFCKKHASQYEDHAARQRFADQQYDRVANLPMHNHGPSEQEPVQGCPLCSHKYGS